MEEEKREGQGGAGRRKMDKREGKCKVEILFFVFFKGLSGNCKKHLIKMA